MKPKTYSIITETCRVHTYYVAVCDAGGQTLYYHQDEWDGSRKWLPDPVLAYGLSNDKADSIRMLKPIRNGKHRPKGAANFRLMTIRKTVRLIVEEVK